MGDHRLDRLKILTYVMMAIGALYVFDSINTGGLSQGIGGNSVTGLVVADSGVLSSSEILNQEVSCYDTDNRNHYEQGTTYAKLLKLNGEAPKRDECDESGSGVLLEYYCVFNELQVEFHDCPNGCINGRCA